MTVEDLLFFGKKHIHSDHAKIFLAELLKRNPLELLNYLHDEVPKEVSEQYQKGVISLKEGKPLQYVLGYVNFYDYKFYVNKNVLIPRFETEELVENTVKYIKTFFTEPVDIIDLGCGSGVLGLTLEKKISTKSVDLIDISPNALEVTHKNCANLSSKANIIESDMFKNISKKYDVVISNPPYIKTDEEIEPIVFENEPHLALYAGPDGLDCYRKIFEDLALHLKPRALVAFEIGMTQKEDLIKLTKKYLPNATIEVKKDLSGKDRMFFIFQNLV